MNTFQKIYIAVLTVTVALVVYFDLELTSYCFILFVLFSALVFSDKLKSLKVGNVILELDRSAEAIRNNMRSFGELSDQSQAPLFPVIDITGCRLSEDDSLVLRCMKETLEETLKMVCLKWEYPGPWTLNKMLQFLKKKKKLNWYIYDSFSIIIKLLDKLNHLDLNSLHGAADDIMALVDLINANTLPGFSLNIRENKDFKQHGLFCEYEHCIDMMPQTHKDDTDNCVKYGRKCPGGDEQVKECEELKRFQ